MSEITVARAQRKNPTSVCEICENPIVRVTKLLIQTELCILTEIDMNSFQLVEKVIGLIDDFLGPNISSNQFLKYDVFEIDYNDDSLCNAVRELWIRYSALPILKNTVCMVGFEKELKQFVQTSGPASNGATIVASLHNKLNLVGAIAIKPWRHEILNESEKNFKYAELKRLFIEPKYQKQGIATRLIESALEKAKSLGYTHVRLDTLSTMKAAQNLYRKFGFKEIDPMPLDKVNLQMKNSNTQVVFFARKI